MLLSYKKIIETVPDLNIRAHNENDFIEICNKINCEFVPKTLKKSGYFIADKSGDFIFFDLRLFGYKRLEVLFHELTHALLHHPCSFLRFRQEIQAECFALLFLIPKKTLFSLMNTPFDELDRRLIPYLIRRRDIFDRLQI